MVRMGMRLTENAHCLHSLTANSSYTGWFGIDVLAPRPTFHCYIEVNLNIRNLRLNSLML